jgi:hypothetical protein
MTPIRNWANLLRRSTGPNLGFEYLSSARSLDPQNTRRVLTPCWPQRSSGSTASSRIPTGTAKNPNLLWSGGSLWLIDHGASLGFQHDWSRVTEQAPRIEPRWQAADHVLHARATELQRVDDRLASRLRRDVLTSALDAVPDEFLPGLAPDAANRRRAAYVAFSLEAPSTPAAIHARRGLGCRVDANAPSTPTAGDRRVLRSQRRRADVLNQGGASWSSSARRS